MSTSLLSECPPVTPASYLYMSLSFHPFISTSFFLSVWVSPRHPPPPPSLLMPLFRFSLSIFHLLSVTLRDESIFLRKRNLICLAWGKKILFVILSAISTFSVMISNIQRSKEKEKLLQKSSELFAKHKSEMRDFIFFFIIREAYARELWF